MTWYRTGLCTNTTGYKHDRIQTWLDKNRTLHKHDWIQTWVSRCFEPSQPQRITSGLNITHNLTQTRLDTNGTWNKHVPTGLETKMIQQTHKNKYNEDNKRDLTQPAPEDAPHTVQVWHLTLLPCHWPGFPLPPAFRFTICSLFYLRFPGLTLSPPSWLMVSHPLPSLVGNRLFFHNFKAGSCGFTSHISNLTSHVSTRKNQH